MMRSPLYPLLLSLFMLPLPLVAEPQLSWSGAIEFEAGQISQSGGVRDRSMAVATAAIGLDLLLSERVEGHLLLLRKQGSPFALDVATITLHLDERHHLTAGEHYLPFGRYESFMVTLPVTLRLGESRAPQMQYTYTEGGMIGAFYLFKGEVAVAADGADSSRLGYGFDWQVSGDRWGVGLSYLADLAESNLLKAAVQATSPTTPLADRVAGGAFYLRLSQGPLTLFAEQVMAMGDFAATDFAATGDLRPATRSVEIGYEVAPGTTLAVASQQTQQAEVFALPRRWHGLSVGGQVDPALRAAVELARFSDYGGRRGESLMVRLAVEF
jgi:hypothetical protein